VKDKESELKAAEQKLHDEFERLRRQNAEEKRQLDDKKRQLVCTQLHVPGHLESSYFLRVRLHDSMVTSFIRVPNNDIHRNAAVH